MKRWQGAILSCIPVIPVVMNNCQHRYPGGNLKWYRDASGAHLFMRVSTKRAMGPFGPIDEHENGAPDNGHREFFIPVVNPVILQQPKGTLTR